MLTILKDSIADTGLKTMSTEITQRQAYVRTMLDGGTIYDTDDYQAKGEIDVLTDEILGLIK